MSHLASSLARNVLKLLSRNATALVTFKLGKMMHHTGRSYRPRSRTYSVASAVGRSSEQLMHIGILYGLSMVACTSLDTAQLHFRQE